ncbi:MAG: methyltransferase domain-containing protein [Pseudonocardia sp.]|nr:methyltransferase domain-containing protein [Pseudonocardia sp.]
MRADQETYTHGHAPSVLRSHTARTVANSAAYVAHRLVPGADVLDVGCGPGTISLDIAERVAPGRVLAIDSAEAPLADARARAAGIDTITFAVGDAYALDVPDDSMDVVHAHQVLQHLTDPVAALREMLRACRPDGIVAVRDADYAAMTWYPADPRLDRWLAVYRAVARSSGAQPDAGRHLLAWTRAAGAATVTPTASVWCYATPADRAWWGGLWADRIVESAIAGRAVDGGHADAAELRGISEAWRAWSEHPDGWFAVLHGEVLARPAQPGRDRP